LKWCLEKSANHVCAWRDRPNITFDKEITLYQRDELTRYRSFEVYTQSSGVEIREAVKSHEENGRVLERVGQIQLLFFKLTSKTRSDEVTQIRFICEPDEALALAPMIGQVAGSSVPCREKLNPHKFAGGEQGGETVTTVSVEKVEAGRQGWLCPDNRARQGVHQCRHAVDKVSLCRRISVGVCHRAMLSGAVLQKGTSGIKRAELSSRIGFVVQRYSWFQGV